MRNDKKCLVERCQDTAFTKGMCQNHYKHDYKIRKRLLLKINNVNI